MKHKSIRSKILFGIILASLALPGCASRAGQTAAKTAQQLINAGQYQEAARQCAIAIGNGINDKNFVHLAEVLNLYNSASSLYDSGNIEDAKNTVAQITDYSNFSMAGDIDKLKNKITGAADNSTAIDQALDRISDLYDNERFELVQEELIRLDENKMTDAQKDKYKKYQEKINNKIRNGGIAGTSDPSQSYQSYQSSQSSVSSTPDYSKYDSTLSKAYIMGADKGSVYFWTGSSGNGHSSTIPNGTTVYTTTQKANGRTLVKWNGQYGWITSQYVNVGDVGSYTTNYHIQNAETGSVYVWKYSTGNESYSTIPNGTIVYPTGEVSDGRVRIRWGNGYGWITSKYIG